MRATIASRITSWVWVILAVLLGVAAGLFISGYWLSSAYPPGSRALLLGTVLASAAAAAGFVFLLRWLRTLWKGLSTPKRVLATVMGVVTGAYLFFAGTSAWQSQNMYLTLLLPRHEFKIRGDDAPVGTKLVWLSTSLGDIPYDTLSLTGWSRDGDVLVLESPSRSSVEGAATPGDTLKLVLDSSRGEGSAVFEWESGREVIPLAKQRTEYEKFFAVPWYASRGLLILLGLVCFSMISVALVLAADQWGRRWLADGVQNEHEHTARSRLTEWLIIAAIVAVAFLLRVFRLNAIYPAVDEYYHLIAANQLLNGAALDSVYQRGLWIVTLPVALGLRIFGHQVWAGRLAGVLFNVAAVIPLYWMTRKISRAVAMAACVLFAASPWLITFARIAREYAYYPFYFYSIVFAMIALIEAIPLNTSIVRDWRQLLRPKTMLLAAVLILPPIYAQKLDGLSTFRTILIAYPVLAVFALGRLDWRERANWPLLLAVLAIVFYTARGVIFEQFAKLSVIPQANSVPVEYFFPNPPQQWYFNRIGVLAAGALLAALVGGIVLRRKHFTPLFFVALFLSYWGVFVFFSRSFFHTRHLMTTELWFVIVMAIGMTWIASAILRLLPWKGRIVRWSITLGLGIALLNPMQIALPSLWSSPDMPISEDYMHDMSAVQAYMLDHASPGDALVSTVYGLYAAWESKPEFAAQTRISSHTTRDELEALVQQYASGWIVIDSIRLDLAPFSERDITNMPQIEYIGVFGDEHVWRWP